MMTDRPDKEMDQIFKAQDTEALENTILPLEEALDYRFRKEEKRRVCGIVYVCAWIA
jgi:hypothetical protein